MLLLVHFLFNFSFIYRLNPRVKAKTKETYQGSIAEGSKVIQGKVEEDEAMIVLAGNLGPNDSILAEFNLVFYLSSDESLRILSKPSEFLPYSELTSMLSFDFSLQILSHSPKSS